MGRPPSMRKSSFNLPSGEVTCCAAAARARSAKAEVRKIFFMEWGYISGVDAHLYNKACCRSRGACFRRTRGGGRSIGRAVVFFHAPFGPSTQKLRTFSHTKIIIRSTCAHCARKKRAAVCIFQPFEGVFFLFIVRIVCKTRHLGLSSRGQQRESSANVGRTPRSSAEERLRLT